MQYGCRVDAGWMQGGCRVDAGWMQGGCRVDAGWMQGVCVAYLTWGTQFYFVVLVPHRSIRMHGGRRISQSPPCFPTSSWELFDTEG